MTVLYSKKTDPTYENFVADCPHCSASNIFNRASGLRTFRPIALRTVECQACDRPFKINNDLVNAAQQVLLFDCYAFIERKQYMQCVLSVAQAYEVFFSHFLNVQLIYRPFARDDRHNLKGLHDVTEKLYEHVHQFAFGEMRRLFLRLVVGNVAPASLAEAEARIANLPKHRKVPPVPRQDVEAVPDDRLKTLLLRLKDANVSELRGRVVHKDAYRPTLEEAKRAHDEAREILHGLTGLLKLGFDAHWYISEAGR
jgi:hypothetical protein